MRVKRGGEGGKGKRGKKGDKKSKRKKTQWGDEHMARADDPGLSGEEIQVAKRRPPPRETQEKHDKLYRVMRRQSELEVGLK